jgi:hypothetical protein
MRVTTWNPEGLHRYPMWRSRADCVIAAPLPGRGSSEQLWARRVGDRLFQVCCIPFLVDDLALGDVVETDADHSMLRVAASSGHSTFRVRLQAAAVTGASTVESGAPPAGDTGVRGAPEPAEPVAGEASSGRPAERGAGSRRPAESGAGELAEPPKPGAGEAAEEILTELLRLGAALEWSSTNLLAVDAAARDDAAELTRYLSDCERRRCLSYRVGKLA